MIKRVSFAWLLGACLWAAGCGSPEAQFHLDRVYLYKSVGLPETREDANNLEKQVQNLKDIMAGLFGTPDDPHVPRLVEVDTREVLREELLRMAAGPVGRDEQGTPRGLYREHCAHCHGITGDGAGPTAAFLNPYPRDYRTGKFKFKSTPLGKKPTHDDLRRILIDGIPDTAMPSFRLLADDEIDALVDYVKYLAIRGEVERRLVDLLGDVDPGAPLLDPKTRDEDPDLFEEMLAIIQEEVALVFSNWAEAPSAVTETPDPPADWLTEESVRHGRELFFNSTTGPCAKCHGQLGLGDGETGDYDDWVKEIDEQNPTAKAAEYLALGLSEPRLIDPRPIRPRNLRAGVYRGGRRPVDLYLRIKNGIEGTPMPGASAGLTSDDIWRIVAYIRSLPQEPISKPEGYQVEFDRERM